MVAALRSATLAASFAFAALCAASAPEETLLAADNECDASGAQCGLNTLQRRMNAVVDAGGAPAADVAAAFTQCGGKEWLGATSCAAGTRCLRKDQWYSQCVPVQPEGLATSQDDGEDDDEESEDRRRRRRRRRRSTTEAPTEAPTEDPTEAPTEDPTEATTESPTTKSPTKGKGRGSKVVLPPNPPMPEPPTVKKIHPIVIKGNFLYDSFSGKRFFAKGTSYNPRNTPFSPDGRSKGSGCKAGSARAEAYTFDVISDDAEERWSADLKAIANLGANTIRIFNLDPSQDHSKFMKAAAAFGIYVILPLNAKDHAFLPAFPSPDCYCKNMTHEVSNDDGTTRPYGNVGTNVLTFAKQVVKQFSKFDNTLLFTVNNEFAMNDQNGFAGFQCVKALTRDVHQYQKSCGESMRRVPLIYSDYDMGSPDRGIIANYLSCALESEDDAIDAYGLNVYSYCEEKYPGDGKEDNFQYSPYMDIKKDYKDFSAPVLFTEFGCPDGDFLSFCPYKGGRTWPDVKYFFNEELGEILSGAIAYTYEQDQEERGLVLTPGFLHGQNDLYFLDSYYALQKQFKAHDVNPSWDGADITDCTWTPDKAHEMQGSHSRPQCPTTAVGKGVQRKRGVSHLTDWRVLPPPAHAPLADVGQEECPAYKVDKDMAAESKCHFKEGA